MRHSDAAPLGAEWECTSSIWGRRCGSGDWVDQVSPLDSRLVQRVRFLGPTETSELLRAQAPLERIDEESLRRFCSRLYDELRELYPSIVETTQWETGFIRSDCVEVVLSSLDYVKGFPEYFRTLPDAAAAPLTYKDSAGRRRVQQSAVPWGTVAAILPQSAFLFLAVTCLLNALAAGNRVILRAPTQSARSAALLCLAVERAAPADCVSIVLAPAQAFLAALCESPEPLLVHYLGGSAHAPEILSSCFQAGKHALIDGEGNAWVWVDEDTPLDYASDLLTSGALRYNGQTCTSVNGAVVHPRTYDRLAERLAARWGEITAGDPFDARTQVGPLLSEGQAEHCLKRIEESGAGVLAGGSRDGNLLAPTLAAEPREDSELVSHGFFGAALWLAPGDIDRFAALWRRNRYPLCAGVLTRSGDPQRYLHGLPGVARLVVNGDPSVEYMYEPWGGYPASGANAVSYWHRKYLRTVQVDCPA